MLQQTIEVQHKGQTIRGMIYRPNQSTRVPTVLMLHSFAGQRAENGFMYVQIAKILCNLGIAAVTFDFRHSGESDGTFDQMLATEELSDAIHMTQWVRSQPFVDRTKLACLGFSLGGMLCASMARCLPNIYQTMVLLAPTTASNLARLAAHEKIDNQVVIGPHILHVNFFDDLKTMNPVADIIYHKGSTLLIQGTADKSVPPNVSQAFIDARTREDLPIEVKLIADANHPFNHYQTRRTLLETVENWFRNWHQSHQSRK